MSEIYTNCIDIPRSFCTAYLNVSCSDVLRSSGPIVLGVVGAVTVISPLELIRTKMQSQQLTYKQLGACVRQAVAQGGWRSFWQGWAPTMFRDVPFSGKQ